MLKLFLILLSLLLMPHVVVAVGILDLPNVGVPAGNTATIALSIDNAQGVAAISAQINYNPEVASYQSITVPAGSLGEQFEVSWEENDGVIRLWLASDEPMPAGGGVLLQIDLIVTPGSPNGLYTDLAIAEVDIADEMGIQLNRGSTQSPDHGRLTSSDVAYTDLDSDGLPDDWEITYTLDTSVDSSGGDEDGDGVANLLEYAFGMDPTIAQLNMLPVGGTTLIAGDNYLTLNFRRLLNYQTISYHVESGSNLINWDEGDAFEYLPSFDNGDGLTESAFFRDIFSIDNFGKRFMRVRITSE